MAERRAGEVVPERAGVRRGLLAAAVLALFAAFLVARFPWSQLLPSLLGLAAGATGAEVRAEQLGLGLGRGGPELVVHGLSLRWPGSEPLAFEAVALRPAWSPGWLLGRPRWHVAARGPAGSWTGELAFDRVAGELVELDV